MPDPGLASPYRLEGNKYQAIADIFTGIAGNKQDRLKNKLTEAQIRNATLLGDKRAVDLEEAKWAWGNVAKTPEALAKLLEGISGGGADAEAAFILGTTPEMVQKWKALQGGLNDIQRRTTIVNDEKRKADKAYRDGQIDQVQYDKIVAQTETELNRTKKEEYEAKIRKNKIDRILIGGQAEDRLTGEDVRRREAERKKTIGDYSKSGLPPHAEPDLPPELRGLERGSDEWKRIFQQWIINAKPNQAQIDAVASGGTIAGSVSKKAKPIDFPTALKQSGFTPAELRRGLADHIGLLIEEHSKKSIDSREEAELKNLIYNATLKQWNKDRSQDPKEIYNTIIANIDNYMSKETMNTWGRWDLGMKDDWVDYTPMSVDEVLKKTFPSAGKFSRAQANARIAQLRAEGKGNEEIFTIMQQEGFNP